MDFEFGADDPFVMYDHERAEFNRKAKHPDAVRQFLAEPIDRFCSRRAWRTIHDPATTRATIKVTGLAWEKLLNPAAYARGEVQMR